MKKIIHWGMVLAFFTLTAKAQLQPTSQSKDTIWRKLPSPMASSVRSFAQDTHQGFYAATASGLFKSDNGGTTWRDAGLKGKTVDKIFITSKGTLLAGCYRQGLFRSLNEGKSWESVGFDKNVYLFTIVEDQNNGLFAAAAYTTTSTTPIPTGLFKSIDDGKHGNKPH